MFNGTMKKIAAAAALCACIMSAKPSEACMPTVKIDKKYVACVVMAAIIGIPIPIPLPVITIPVQRIPGSI